jgi:type III secretion system YscD/HrpQ family protein
LISLVDSNTPNPCVLKVLSGPHQGAEMLLSPGTYTVGSSEDCDVILSDALFQGRQFKLTFLPPSVTMEVIDGTTFLNGKMVGREAVEVPFFQFITVGTTHIVIGPSGEGWPLLRAEDAPPLDLTPPKETAPQAEEITSMPIAPAITQPNSDALAEAMALASDKPLNNAAALEKGLEENKFSPAIKKLMHNRQALIAAAAALALGGGFLAFESLTAKTNMAPTVAEAAPLSLEERTKKIEKILQMHHLEKDLKTFQVQNQVGVEGYLKKESDRQSLQKAILREDPRALFQVQSEENLIQLSQKVLKDMGLAVEITPSSTLGTLKASGYILDGAIWEQAKALLASDFTALKPLEDEVLTGKKIQSFLKPLLKENGLTGALECQTLSDKIQVRGVLTEPQGLLWDNIASQLNAKVNERIPIVESIIRARPEVIEERYFDSAIQSLTTGRFGYVSLKSGEKYFTGSVLPSGYSIVSVETDGITLRKGEAEVVFKPHQS